MFSGRTIASATQDLGMTEGTQGDKAFAGLILILAQLSAFIEQTAIPRITEARILLIDLSEIPEFVFRYAVSFHLISLGYAFQRSLSFQEIAASFSGGSARGNEYGPAFVPGEICRKFRSAGENFLHLVSYQFIRMCARTRTHTEALPICLQFV